MKALLLAAPIVFVAAFIVGYRDDAQAHRVRSFGCAVLVAVAGATGFMAPSVPATWSVINLGATVFCALAIVDGVTKRNRYSGYGAMLLFPFALAAALSLVAVGLVALRAG